MGFLDLRKRGRFFVVVLLLLRVQIMACGGLLVGFVVACNLFRCALWWVCDEFHGGSQWYRVGLRCFLVGDLKCEPFI